LPGEVEQFEETPISFERAGTVEILVRRSSFRRSCFAQDDRASECGYEADGVLAGGAQGIAGEEAYEVNYFQLVAQVLSVAL
jgi:hypothetical protein